MKPKSISKEEYIKKYCHDRRIRRRKAIYVEPHIYDELKIVVGLFKKTHVSLISLVSAILSEHLETYRPFLDQLLEERKKGRLRVPDNDSADTAYATDTDDRQEEE